MTVPAAPAPPANRGRSTPSRRSPVCRPLASILLLCLASAATAEAAAPPRRGRTPTSVPPRPARTVPRGGGAAAASSTAAATAQPRTASSAAAVEGLKNSLASGLAAACSKALLAPFDTIKTVQQQVRSEAGGKALGFGQAARRIVDRPGGFLELYAGLGVSALGAMPSVGLYFGVYSYSKRILVPFLRRTVGSGRTEDEGGGGRPPLMSDGALGVAAVAASAAIGNTVASFSRVPYEVVKQKLQTGQYSGTFSAISSMFSEGGMRAFFPLGGISIQMVRDIPYAMFTLISYEALRENWVKRAEVQRPWRDMAAGAMSGGIGSYLTNPMDVVKTRLQTDPELYGGSVVGCARATFEEGGPMAFLRGSVPRLMHKIPANGAFFVFYELFRRVLKVEGASGTAGGADAADGGKSER